MLLHVHYSAGLQVTYCRLKDDIKLQLTQAKFSLTVRKIEPGTQHNTLRILIFMHSADMMHA